VEFSAGEGDDREAAHTLAYAKTVLGLRRLLYKKEAGRRNSRN
jgi:hypothetical protein